MRELGLGSLGEEFEVRGGRIWVQGLVQKSWARGLGFELGKKREG